MSPRPERNRPEERGGFARLVLQPAVALMNRLGYAQKFALIGLLLLTPLAVVSYLQVRLATASLDFNQKESYGVAYITPLKEMQRQVQHHRLYFSAVLMGHVRFEDRL